MAKSLDIGAKAPPFSLPRDGGGVISLAEHIGKKVVLYFYPKDDTSGCTREALDFEGAQAAFKKAGAVVIGISPDSAASHDKFKKKHGLSLPLAADTEKNILQAYGVWVEKSMYGRKYMGVERSTFLIDGKGIIRQIWRKVSVPGHVEEVLKATRAL